MLEAAVSKYNWAYLDGYNENIDLRPFWLFMLWRLQNHASVDRLIEEVSIAFPDLLQQLDPGTYFSPKEQLGHIIECRFVERFLQYWGFITINPRKYDGEKRLARKANIQALLTQGFTFTR